MCLFLHIQSHFPICFTNLHSFFIISFMFLVPWFFLCQKKTEQQQSDQHFYCLPHPHLPHALPQPRGVRMPRGLEALAHLRCPTDSSSSSSSSCCFLQSLYFPEWRMKHQKSKETLVKSWLCTTRMSGHVWNTANWHLVVVPANRHSPVRWQANLLSKKHRLIRDYFQKNTWVWWSSLIRWFADG